MIDRITEPEVMDNIDQCMQFSAGPRSLLRAKFIRCMLEHLKMEGSVIDLGCGPGDYDKAIADNFKNIMLTGLDKSDIMLQLAKQYESENLKFTDQTNEQYDIVISANTLHHFHNPLEFWNEVKRLSKPNAQIMIMDMVRPNSLEEINFILKEAGTNNLPLYEQDFYNSLRACFTPDEISNQLERAELNLIVKPMGAHSPLKTVLIYGRIN